MFVHMYIHAQRVNFFWGTTTTISVSDPFNFDVDPDPDPWIHILE